MGSNRRRKNEEIAAFLAELDRISALPERGPIYTKRGLFSDMHGSDPKTTTKKNKL